MIKYMLVENTLDIPEVTHYIYDNQYVMDRLQQSISHYERIINNNPTIIVENELKQVRDELNDIMSKPEYTYTELVKQFGIDSIAYQMPYDEHYYIVTDDGIRKCLPGTLIDNSTLITNDELEDAYNNYKGCNVINKPYVVLIYGQVKKGRDYGLTPKFIIKNKVA